MQPSFIWKTWRYFFNIQFYKMCKNYEFIIDKNLKKKLENNHKFCDGCLNNLILLLQKWAYPSEYIDSWNELNKSLLPNKESFNYNVSLENIYNSDYRHAKKLYNTVEIKKIQEIIITYICKVYYPLMFLKTLEKPV